MIEHFDSLLEKYADFIVRVGTNVQPGQTLILSAPIAAAPLARLCVRSAFAAGARDVRVDWSDDAVTRARMELGSEEALCDVKPYLLRSYLDYAESEGGVCVLNLLASDPEALAGLDAGKVSRVNAARRKALMPWRSYTMNDRVQWSIAAMPSPAWAKKLFPDLAEDEAVEKLWQLIFDTCRVTTDLTVGLADGAVWESAASQNEKGVSFLPNIPTEEVFTAPHKDKVDGVVYGTKPYIHGGQAIQGFHVTFKGGKIVEYGAEENEALLGEVLDTDEGARHIGEVALVPASSPINRSGVIFYNTLFDENASCHIAFGASYPGTTRGGTALTEEELLARGMNQSLIHEDVMIGAADTRITGRTRDGREVALFEKGEWVL